MGFKWALIYFVFLNIENLTNDTLNIKLKPLVRGGEVLISESVNHSFNQFVKMAQKQSKRLSL